MKRLIALMGLVLMMGLLSGCLYPQERRQHAEQLPQHIMNVQAAVDAYFKEHKELPYKYTENEHKLTTKYLVNFKTLQGYLNDIPPTAFEKGGNFLYVLINVEKKPTVRVYDLRVDGEISKVQPYVNRYVEEKGQIPRLDQVASGYYTINFDQLGVDPVTIPSPYSTDTQLPLLVDSQGKVYVDYRTEVMKKIQGSQKKPEAGQDVREWLAQDSFFVPAFSPAMKMEEGDPVFAPVRQK
ncbi:DUF3939 domain-containing protein [Paenactinomyces guangxiensis]|uniref:DUF3939 domain-containing protein n=1 Tax=Paenactinomyces guangxiensis TaxID=1490290 RepID=A0A7W1WTC6_9BACL|nr:DUF3939 domain-containing protein [Paenactinomyces guangxiensis]MBA4495612.1 DUF3939 domain-containing protein [Paenactinomyces guangxiensis]MBH8592600.1 DUF3939 domain-containing protein [Paenactinomyces guangxiensis]